MDSFEAMGTTGHPGDFVCYDEHGRVVRRSLRIWQNRKYTNPDGSRAFFYFESARRGPRPPSPTWRPNLAAPQWPAPRVNKRRGLQVNPPVTPATPTPAALPAATSDWPMSYLPTRLLLYIALFIAAFSLYSMCSFMWARRPNTADWMRSTTQDKLPNYALIAKGACIHRKLSSEEYVRNGGMFLRFLAKYSLRYLNVLQEGSPLIPGNCWQFEGSVGQLHIELSEPVHIDHVTIGHITKSQSPNQQVISAPKHVSVYGKKTLYGEETLLSEFTYSDEGPAFQTFTILNPSVQESFRHVRIQISSNWGNPEYTCLYNIRVHGKPAPV